MGKLNTVYQAILARCEKISHKEDIMKIIKEYNDSIKKVNMKNALWYFSRHGYITRIFLDYYYINSIEERELGYQQEYESREILFIVLNKAKWKWYIGLTSALYESREIWQVPNTLTIINDRITRKKRILGMDVKFIKMKKKLFFGLISKRTKKNVKYFYSEPAKTELDFIYLRRYDKIDNKTKKTIEYARMYPKWLQKSI
ncbi:MAG TPA: hypothetical protein VJK03_02865 [Candidatus Nanoarchaeia archaeon]|nr:hypothetical protein [Candidatus Nanoarchaeia archaeon]